MGVFSDDFRDNAKTFLPTPLRQSLVIMTRTSFPYNRGFLTSTQIHRATPSLVVPAFRHRQGGGIACLDIVFCVGNLTTPGSLKDGKTSLGTHLMGQDQYQHSNNDPVDGEGYKPVFTHPSHKPGDCGIRHQE